MRWLNSEIERTPVAYFTVWMRVKAPAPTRAVAMKSALVAKRTLEGEKADRGEIRVCGRVDGARVCGGRVDAVGAGRRGGGLGTLRARNMGKSST